jgi:branched-chain amino acid transport system substrate-binding protein
VVGFAWHHLGGGIGRGRRPGGIFRQDDQDRRAQRSIGPLCRYRGYRLGLGRAQSGRGFWRRRQGHEGRDPLRRSPEQARHRLEHRAPLVRRRQGRCRRRNTVHWIYDTWALANGTGNAIVKRGGDTWFFLTADYAFGYALERDTEAVVLKSGGKVLGKVRHPFPGTDFSSFLLQAKASGAKIIGLANAGGDTINSIKQASEFGIVQGGQKLAGLLIFITDIHALGLKTAQGLIFTDPWYWDQNDANRAFAKEYFAAHGRMPSYTVVGVYSAVFHYLRAVEALGSHADGKAVVAKMKELPTEDKLMGKGSVRIDGRKIHPMYLFEVKKPDESKGPWDYYKQLATIPAEEAWRPLDQGECPLVRK